ncbi:hypothetical protein M2284_005282 [Rhodococcus sp. LBL1]|nr:hypothetical protein [Rhodococcus sp. LBL1]MDH6686345.1 hypothetical protein [Rhodococcus sp. LBL2]
MPYPGPVQSVRNTGVAKRKPTIPERAQLARAAVEYIEHYTAKEPDASAYDLAFRGLGKIGWLHAQSRDGIAAYAAQCWATGQQPYAGHSHYDLQLAELDRQAQSRHNRRVALERSAELRRKRDT